MFAPISRKQRSRQRFEMELELTFKTFFGKDVVSHGSGTVCNIGSGGLLFRTADTVSDEGEIELTVHWPALLDGTSRLNLVMRGKVVRNDVMGCAVKTINYEFRTRASRPLVFGIAARNAAAGWVGNAPTAIPYLAIPPQSMVAAPPQVARTG